MNNVKRGKLLIAGLAALPLILAGCSSTPSRLDETLASISQRTAELPAAPFRDVLTVQTAIERAFASSDEIAMLASTVDVAAQQRLAAHDWRDPELRATYGQDTEDTTRSQLSSVAGIPTTGIPGVPAIPTGSSMGTIEDESTQYGLALRLFPPNPWVQDQTLTMDEANTYAAVAQLLDAQWRLANEVRRHFAEIDHLNADLKLLNDLTTLYSNAVETIDLRTEQGESTLEDVLSASRRYMSALSEKDKTSRQRDQARRELANLAAVSTDDLLIRVDASTFWDADLGEVDVPAMEASALENRRDLAALYWQTRAAWAGYDLARTERWPWLTFIEASYGSTDSSSDRNFTSTGTLPLDPVESSSAVDDGSGDEWQIAAGITLPILPGKDHSVKISMAEYRGAELQEERAKARIKREIREAIGAVRAITRARTAMERESEPILRQMQEGLSRLESTTGLDPEDAVRIREQILETKRLKLSSNLEYRLAVIDLEEVLGMRLGRQVETRP